MNYPMNEDSFDEDSLTPMMAQYWAIKKENKQHLLFYRMGDFYELFFHDAEIAAPLLDIVLTHRSKHMDKDIPMCGVPVATVNDYLAKLVQAGFTVAICEQLESPQEAKERGYKELVRRGVVRIVTPGTLTEETLLEARKPNNLIAVTVANDVFSIASIDISTGQFLVETISSAELTGAISRLSPREILMPTHVRNGQWGDFFAQQAHVSVLPDSKFNVRIEEERLRKFFNVHDLLSFGSFSKSEIVVCGALLEYLHLTQKEALGPLSPPHKISSRAYVVVDASTRRNLELICSCKGDPKNSLWNVLDQTITAHGGRLLFERLSSPIRNIATLETRLDAIDFWRSHPEEHAFVVPLLKKTPDATRALSRLSLKRGTTNDLYIILETLKSFRSIRDHFSVVFQEGTTSCNGGNSSPNKSSFNGDPPHGNPITLSVSSTSSNKDTFPFSSDTAASQNKRALSSDGYASFFNKDTTFPDGDLSAFYGNTLSLGVDTLPASSDTADLQNGIATGDPVSCSVEESSCLHRNGEPHNAGELSSTLFALACPVALQDLLEKALIDPSRLTASDFVAPKFCAELDRYRTMRDHSKELIANLKKHYITETGINSLKIQFNYILGWHIDVPTSQVSRLPETFLHRQTLASSARYTTLELQELQENLEMAADKCSVLEQQIFEELSGSVLKLEKEIREIAYALAVIDLSQSFASLAQERQYVRPTFTEAPILSIQRGRHPLVECRDASAKKNGFIANSCQLDDTATFVLLTGPNMAGKSTYLRQNALIALMAHMGFFVPAESAHIGIIDRLFSRIGASDDLAQGYSTFMVEMVETAAILNQTTPHSFVILDEVGRGTSTFDGLSLAWAIAERLHSTGVRTLFATHYHELTQLRYSLKRLKCETLKIQEWEDAIVFLHEVAEGISDRSYGLYVAKRAGFPQEVLARAQEVLDTLQNEHKGKAGAVKPSKPKQATFLPSSVVEEKIRRAKLDDLSPREALQLLYALQSEAGSTKCTH